MQSTPNQKAQQEEGLSATPSCPTRRELQACAKLAWMKAEVELHRLTDTHILGQLSEVHYVLTQNVFISFFFSCVTASQAVYH